MEEAIAHEIGQDLLRLKQPTFIHSEQFDLEAFGREFDYILAQSVFTHASSPQIQLCLCAAQKVMHQHSIFVVNFSEGADDYRGDSWVYPEFVQYTFAHISQLASDASLRCGRINWTRPPAGQTWSVMVRPEYGDMEPLVEPYAQLKALRTCQEQLEFCTKQLGRVFGTARRIIRGNARVDGT